MANTLTTINDALMYVQENKLKDLRPASAIFYEKTSLKEPETVGRKYLAPVVLSYELGYTFGDGSDFTYNATVQGVYDEIEIDSNPVVLVSRISIEAADRAARSNKSALDMTVIRTGQMKQSLIRLAEIEIMHGKTGLGNFASVGTINTTPTPDEVDVVFTAATFAPGIWGGMEGVKLDAYNGVTKLNTNADITLVAVDFENLTLKLSGDNTDLTALGAGHTLYFKGAFANGQFGLKYQLTTDGSIFGIDNTVYALWRSQRHAVGGNLTMEQVLKGRALAVSRVGLDQDSELFVSPATFENLHSEIAALRNYDQSYSPKKGKSGVKSIEYCAQGGSIFVISHPMMMEGEAYMLPKDSCKKVGSKEVTFAGPSDEKGSWQLLENSHAYQLVARFSFQIFIQEPAKCIFYSGITNS